MVFKKGEPGYWKGRKRKNKCWTHGLTKETDARIARVAEINRKLKTLKLPQRKLEKMCSEGKLLKEIANHFNCCRNTIQKRLRHIDKKEHVSKRMRDNNPMKNESTRAKVGDSLREKYATDSKAKLRLLESARRRLLKSSLRNPAEQKLYKLLKEMKIEYEPQGIINNKYICDAVLRKSGIIIEIDGRIHETIAKESTRRKKEELESSGWKVVSITFESLLTREAIEKWL